jgi:hypothetical protein
VLCRFRSNTDSESGLVVRNPFSFSFSFSYIYREMCLYAPCNNKSDFSCLLHNNKDGIVARIYVDSAGILGWDDRSFIYYSTMFALPAGGSMNHHIIAAYEDAPALCCACVWMDETSHSLRWSPPLLTEHCLASVSPKPHVGANHHGAFPPPFCRPHPHSFRRKPPMDCRGPEWQ